MHDIIHSELQKARVADFRRRAEQDRLGREAVQHVRRRALGPVLAVLSARRSALRQLAGQARTSDAPLGGRAEVSGARPTPSPANR
jgi:hypothetical protein